MDFSQKNKTLIIGGHGLGDCILSFQSKYLFDLVFGENSSDIAISTRKEIFDVIQYFFSKYNPIELDESLSSNHGILTDEIFENFKQTYKYSNYNYVIPDLLFRGRLSFNYPQIPINIIKQARLLLSKDNCRDKRIYLALQTTTPGYLYSEIDDLIDILAHKFPDYEIYFPQPETWANQSLYKVKKTFPNNVRIDQNCSLLDSLRILRSSSYCICTCNGPSHFAYQFGIPRLVLDPQFDKKPWIARWKEDYLESIPIQINPSFIANIVENNLRNRESLLLPRFMAIKENVNWAQELYFKL